MAGQHAPDGSAAPMAGQHAPDGSAAPMAGQHAPAKNPTKSTRPGQSEPEFTFTLLEKSNKIKNLEKMPQNQRFAPPWQIFRDFSMAWGGRSPSHVGLGREKPA